MNQTNRNEPYNKAQLLDSTITQHFLAIINRNISALLKTVNQENITLILPNGKHSGTYEDYKAVNEEWFADNDWRIEHKIKEKKVNTNTAIVLTEITYFDKDENGDSYSFQYYLTLIFEWDKNDWKLVFDQNTIIK